MVYGTPIALRCHGFNSEFVVQVDILAEANICPQQLTAVYSLQTKENLMSKLDELKGKAKATIENLKDDAEETRENVEHKTDEAKGYAETREF